jgi:hypothetical protein
VHTHKGRVSRTLVIRVKFSTEDMTRLTQTLNEPDIGLPNHTVVRRESTNTSAEIAQKLGNQKSKTRAKWAPLDAIIMNTGRSGPALARRDGIHLAAEGS